MDDSTASQRNPERIQQLEDAHYRYRHRALRAHLLEVSDVTESDVDAIWSTSCLFRHLMTASLQHRDLEPYNPPQEWLQMLSMACSVSGAICDVLEKSPHLNKSVAHQVIDSLTERLPMKLISLQDVPYPHSNDKVPRDENTEESKIDATLLVQRKFPRDQNEARDDETHDAYRRTVEYLMFVPCGILAQQSREISLIQLVGFGSLAPRMFLDLVSSKASRALLLLARFFGPMKRYTDIWYIGNTPERESGGIRTQLPPEWQELVDWPS